MIGIHHISCKTNKGSFNPEQMITIYFNDVLLLLDISQMFVQKN